MFCSIYWRCGSLCGDEQTSDYRVDPWLCATSWLEHIWDGVTPSQLSSVRWDQGDSDRMRWAAWRHQLPRGRGAEAVYQVSDGGALERPTKQQAWLTFLEAAALCYAMPPATAQSQDPRSRCRRAEPLRSPPHRFSNLSGHSSIDSSSSSPSRAPGRAAQLVPSALTGKAETRALPQLWLRAATGSRSHSASTTHLLQPAAYAA